MLVQNLELAAVMHSSEKGPNIGTIIPRSYNMVYPQIYTITIVIYIDLYI